MKIIVFGSRNLLYLLTIHSIIILCKFMIYGFSRSSGKDALHRQDRRGLILGFLGYSRTYKYIRAVHIPPCFMTWIESSTYIMQYFLKAYILRYFFLLLLVILYFVSVDNVIKVGYLCIRLFVCVCVLLVRMKPFKKFQCSTV